MCAGIDVSVRNFYVAQLDFCAESIDLTTARLSRSMLSLSRDGFFNACRCLVYDRLFNPFAA